ncbi:MAG: HAMP domain-containing protein [Candidatus Omnitrophica bacterium]|nr:HAMP domain-containing protein [Candidatus Omnitrophota bacterium]MBU1996889.1 HAMP domain-containing protein [Candidatus Omnitrophota bacterium]MBU4333632.1 HAMP domain-containing protein [Candidatus Omnitrophota bacterium]
MIIKLNSILFKLLSFTVIILIVSMSLILFVSHYQLEAINEASQNEIYSERIDSIMEILSGGYRRLMEKPNVVDYIKEYQQASLLAIRNRYHETEGYKIYPFVIKANDKTFVHSGGLNKSVGSLDSKNIEKVIRLRSGDFIYKSDLGEKNWCVFKYFKGWDWIVGYVIPVSIKNIEVRIFIRGFFVTLLIVSFIIIFAAWFFIVRIISPIDKLTDAAVAMSSGVLDHKIDVSSNDELGALARSFIFMRDVVSDKIGALNNEILDRAQAEEDLSVVRNYLTNIIDSMPSILIGVDNRLKITQWNKKAHDSIGVSYSDVKGRRLVEAFPALVPEINRIKQAIDERVIIADSKVEIAIGDKTFFSDITIYPLIFENVEGAVIRIDDVTNRINLEESIIQSEKMASVGGLAAGMAHEINNPLAGILQNMQVIQSRIDKGDAKNIQIAKECGTSMGIINKYLVRRGIRSMIEMVMESGIRAARIVDNMLSFSRKSETVLMPQDIRLLLENMVEIAKNDYDLSKKYDFRKIEIVREYDDIISKVMCEKSQIQQVFLNILKNSAHALKELVECQEVSGLGRPEGVAARKPKITLRIKEADNAVQVDIEDNGAGMEEEVRRRIFEPFFTTKEVGMGTGLGLSVSYFIITERHKGKMSVKSTKNKGTKFTIQLPIEGHEK